MPQGTTARPGPWITEEFQREPLNAILDPDLRELIWMKSTQIGGSEMLNNIIGYFIDAVPRSMMLVQPKDQAAREYTEKRINPMIEACACLRDKVQDAANSAKHGSQRLKKFAITCFLKIVGANSAADLRSDPVGVLLFDEVDGYDDDVQGEGDPIAIATRRTDQYDEEKIAKIGTPAKNKGFSRIEKDYQRSSQGRYFVACPFCRHLQAFCWRGEYRVTQDANGLESYEYIGPDDPTAEDGRPDEKDKAAGYNFRYERDERGDVIESSVRYICAGCGEGIDEKYKQRMLDAGRWIHKYPVRKKVRGYHIWAAYSPWKLLWHSLCQEWVEAQGNPEKLKPFVNLRLGETWNEGASEIDLSYLPSRKEAYLDATSTAVDIPSGVGVLVAAADIQHNRIEAQIIGFGRGEESWLIDHEILYGDPGDTRQAEAVRKDSVWSQLDEWLLQDRRHASGLIMHPALTLIDSGDGGNVDAVYDFVMPRQNIVRRVFACKGVERLAKPVLVQMGTTKRGSIRLWSISTEAAKDRIFARIKIKQPGPGFMHFPDWTSDEYFAQLTAEKKVPVKNRFTRRVNWRYVKTHARNEALDMTVYCHAALFVLQKQFNPALYGDLGKLVDMANEAKAPEFVRRARAVLSEGIS